jgi:hypothetical protein
VPGASVAIGQKNLLVALCLKCLNLKYFLEFYCLPADKVLATKQAWFAVVLQMIYLKKNLTESTKLARENNSSQPPSSWRSMNRTPYCVTTHNQRQQIEKKEE